MLTSHEDDDEDNVDERFVAALTRLLLLVGVSASAAVAVTAVAAAGDDDNEAAALLGGERGANAGDGGRGDDRRTVPGWKATDASETVGISTYCCWCWCCSFDSPPEIAARGRFIRNDAT